MGLHNGGTDISHLEDPCDEVLENNSGDPLSILLLLSSLFPCHRDGDYCGEKITLDPFRVGFLGPDGRLFYTDSLSEFIRQFAGRWQHQFK